MDAQPSSHGPVDITDILALVVLVLASMRRLTTKVAEPSDHPHVPEPVFLAWRKSAVDAYGLAVQVSFFKVALNAVWFYGAGGAGPASRPGRRRCAPVHRLGGRPDHRLAEGFERAHPAGGAGDRPSAPRRSASERLTRWGKVAPRASVWCCVVQERTAPSNSLGILLAGLLQVERTADRWEIARAPRTTVRMRRSILVLVPKRWS